MRRLLLLRHAKAERALPGGNDEARPLAERGRRDAAQMGAYLARHGLVADLALVSPSARTRHTWELLGAALQKPPRVEFEKRLYNASASTVAGLVQQTDASVGALLVIGHNPGMHELADILVAAGELEARQRLKENFPTTALAVIDFAIKGWNQLHPQSGRLGHFVTPKSLEPSTD